MRLEGSEERVADDRATQARDRNGSRGSLRVAHDVRPARRELPYLRVGPEGRLVSGAQRTVRIFISTAPAGTFSRTVSPARCPMSALPTGDSFEMRPSAGAASAEPTMTYCSFDPSASTTTWLPISTLS